MKGLQTRFLTQVKSHYPTVSGSRDLYVFLSRHPHGWVYITVGLVQPAGFPSVSSYLEPGERVNPFLFFFFLLSVSFFHAVTSTILTAKQSIIHPVNPSAPSNKHPTPTP